MVEKIGEGVNLIRNIISIVCAVAFIGIVGYFGYNYFFGKTVIESNSKYFELTVPSKYTFEENDIDDEDVEMSKFENNKGLYIFAWAYESSENEFKADAESYYAGYTEDEEESYSNITDLKKTEISGFETYTFTYEYVDEFDEDYYAYTVLINAEEGIYELILEAPKADQDKYKEDLEKIAETFKEL